MYRKLLQTSKYHNCHGYRKIGIHTVRDVETSIVARRDSTWTSPGTVTFFQALTAEIKIQKARSPNNRNDPSFVQVIRLLGWNWTGMSALSEHKEPSTYHIRVSVSPLSNQLGQVSLEKRPRRDGLGRFVVEIARHDRPPWLYSVLRCCQEIPPSVAKHCQAASRSIIR